MNDTAVQAPNTDYKPKLHKNYKLVLQIWLVNNDVVPGSTKMLTQEHVALGKIRFCLTVCHFHVQLLQLTVIIQLCQGKYSFPFYGTFKYM